MTGVHLLRSPLQDRGNLLHLVRPQVEFGLKTMTVMVANLLAIRRLRPSFFGARPTQHRAGHAADQEDRGQIHDDFVFGEMAHGNMLKRIAESAMATEPGSRSFNV